MFKGLEITRNLNQDQAKKVHKNLVHLELQVQSRKRLFRQAKTPLITL